MPKRTRYLVFAGFLVGVPLTTLPERGAGAADECISAPNHQRSASGHWYHRVDRANHRKCWYIGSAEHRGRSVIAKPHRVRVTSTTATAAAEPPAAARPVEPPSVPIRPAVLAAENAGAIEQPAPPTVRNDIFSARWPDLMEANGRV